MKSFYGAMVCLFIAIFASPTLTAIAAPATNFYAINVSTSNDIASGGTFCTLRDAIGIVNAGTTAGTVNGCIITTNGTPIGNVYVLSLPAAPYIYTLDGLELAITGSAGSNTEVYIVGATANPADTIIQADATPNTAFSRVFQMNGFSATSLSVELENLTMRHGRCTGGCNNGGTNGGGFLNHAGSQTTLTNSIITNNTAGVGGGFVNITGGTVIVRNNSRISDNSALSFGGGFYNETGGPATLVTIDDSTFSDNTADLNGGGFFNAGTGSNVVINDSIFSENRAINGGGFINIAEGVVTVTDSTFSDNTADAGGGNASGGGFFNGNVGSSVTIDNSTFSNNSATGAPSYGGGFYNGVGGDVTIRNNSTFTQNEADTGGGGFFNRDTGSSVTIQANSTFSNNTTFGFGGGFYNTVNGTVMIDASTLSVNSAFFGGGFYNLDAGTVTIRAGSLFSNNTATGDPLSGGGGFFNVGASSSVTIQTNSIFSNNSATNNGGGFRNVNGTVTIDASTFSDNTATGINSFGGGFSNTGATANVTIQANSIFTENRALSGGGFLNTGGGTVTIQTGSQFTQNTANINGGGFYSNGVGSNVTIDASTFSENSAVAGGGFYSENESTVTIGNNSVFSVNSATNGGGFFNAGIAFVTIDASIFTANSATNNGGGFHNNNGQVTVTSTNFANNTASVGGAVYNNRNTLNVVQVTGSCIVANSDVAFFNAVGASQIATGNWWGTTNGPSGLGLGSGDSVSANVAFEPFIAIKPLNCDEYATLTINDVSLSEGNAGTTNFVFTVTLDNAVTGGFTIDYATSDGTAIAGSDYVATNGVLTFAGTVGETQTITVQVNGDTTVEADETFTVTLSNPSIASVDFSTTGTGTIVNDDSAVMNIGNVSVTEGDAGTVTATFTVTLTNPVDVAVTVDYATADDTATAPDDYIATNGTLTFPAGTTSQTIDVTVNGDLIDEGASEQFFVNLSNLGAGGRVVTLGTTQGIGTIIDDDDPAGISVSETAIAVTEGGADASFTVVLTSQPTADVNIALGLTNGAPNGAQIDTISPLVFTTANWNVAQTVNVSAIDDTIVEGAHADAVTFAVTSADGDYNGFVLANVTVNITDNDSVGISVSETAIAVTEGGADASFTVVLTSQPTADVNIALGLTNGAPNGAQIDTISPLVFTTANWNVAQTVNVSAIDDTIIEGAHADAVTFAVTSADGDYNGFVLANVTVNITDNDTPALTIIPTIVNVPEGSPDQTYTVVLVAQPSADVTINIATSDNTLCDISPNILTFTDANHTTPQTINVSVLGINGDTCTISHTATGGGYDAVAISDVTLNIVAVLPPPPPPPVDDSSTGESAEENFANLPDAWDIRITSDTTLLISGQQVTFTITVRKLLGGTPVQVDFPVPGVFTIVSATSNRGSVGVNGQLVTYTDDIHVGDVGITTVITQVGANPQAGVVQACITTPVSRCATLSLIQVTQLPATGETPPWAVRLRHLFGLE